MTRASLQEVWFRIAGHPIYKPSLEEVVGAALSWATYYVFYFQPGLDRKAFLRAEFEWWPGEPVFGLLAVSFFVVLGLPALILGGYWVIYRLEWPIFERYRVENWDRIGWNHPDPVKRAEYVALNKLSLKNFIPKQVMLMVLVTAYLLYTRWAGEWTDAKMQYEIDTLPDAWTSIWQIACGLLIFETIFYWGHRMQHRWFYASHKIHHEFHIPNVLTAPWGADADGWVTLFLPGFLPALLFRMHMWTFLMWTVIHYAHTYLDHSGYEFPWSPIQLIPWSGHVRAHDFHHTANVCNYGLYWRFWDWAMGTEQAWLDHEAKRELRIKTTGTADTPARKDVEEYPAAFENNDNAEAQAAAKAQVAAANKDK